MDQPSVLHGTSHTWHLCMEGVNLQTVGIHGYFSKEEEQASMAGERTLYLIINTAGPMLKTAFPWQNEKQACSKNKLWIVKTDVVMSQLQKTFKTF